MAEAPGLGAQMRAQAETYELLRWPTFDRLAERSWPDYRDGGTAARNAIAGRVARAAIAADPKGYALLVARDWLALVTLPQMWSATSPSSQHPFFSACHIHEIFCWAFYPLGGFIRYRVAMLAMSALGTIASLLLVVTAAGRAIARELSPEELALLPMVVTAQGTLLATALVEAGLFRYTLAVHPINVALSLWLVCRASRFAFGYPGAVSVVG